MFDILEEIIHKGKLANDESGLGYKSIVEVPTSGKQSLYNLCKGQESCSSMEASSSTTFFFTFFKGLDISKITIIVGSLIGFKLTKIDKRMSQFP